MLAAEYETLPKPMREAVIEFFDRNEAWLVQVLDMGRKQGSLQFTCSAAAAARMIVSGLEGAMLVARPYGEIARFKTAAAQLLLANCKKEVRIFRQRGCSWFPHRGEDPNFSPVQRPRYR
jgi:hypothetical protein